MWQDILKAAIIGTERNALALPARDDALGKMLTNLNANEREATLLSAAATVVWYERAGRLSNVEVQALPVPAETEDVLSCNARAAQHLALMLSGEYREILPEWFAALAAANKRVPEELLPAVFDFCKVSEEFRQAIIKVMGKRGAWLAKQNPAWKYADGEVDESTWEAGSPLARLGLMQALRATDPMKATDLLRATWQENSPKERVGFLSVLQSELSLADEAFLEFALDDRSTIVRREAADLLGSLPDSAFVQRMIERVRPLVTFSKKGRNKFAVEVTLPTERTEAMIRDGITAKSQNLNVGEKAWWLSLMLEAVPFAFWQEHSGLQREELLQAVKKSEWEKMFMEAWLKGSFRLGELELIEAILPHSSLDYSLTTLAREMSNPKLDALLIALLASENRTKVDDALGWLLMSHQTEWSKKLSATILSDWKSVFAHFLKRHSYQVTTLAVYLHAALIPQALAQLTAYKSDEKTMEKLLNILQFRSDMLKEITQ